MWAIHASIYIHTYIIGHYNRSVRIIDLVSHTTYVVCVNFIHKWRDSLKSTPNDRFFWETFNGNFCLLSEFCQKSAERKSPKKTFRISFWCLAWDSNPGIASNKPTHYSGIYALQIPHHNCPGFAECVIWIYFHYFPSKSQQNPTCHLPQLFHWTDVDVILSGCADDYCEMLCDIALSSWLKHWLHRQLLYERISF